MKFIKMHGAGNDYVYVDCFNQADLNDFAPADLADLARQVSHRHFGIGGDGLILVWPSDVADARMQMFNADGSEGEMCGNGIRCVAKLVYDNGIAQKDNLRIETGAGVLSLELKQDDQGSVHQVVVDMGPPELIASKIPTTIEPPSVDRQIVSMPLEFDGQTIEVTCVSMGNPHCIVFVDKATDDLVLGLGPKIESDPRFPNRINVEFVEVISRTEVRQRTWERGSGETWACGTGASAVCVAGVLAGRTERKILNHLLGGDLVLEWDESTDHVMMTGPATEVFRGEFAVDDQATKQTVATAGQSS